MIRRRWDWLGVTPSEPDRIEGLIEVPALAEALALNKGDCVRHGRRRQLYLSYRRAIQEAVTRPLKAWGTVPPPPQRTPRTRPIEGDLRRILGELSKEFPVLATLAARRRGRQRRLPLAGPDGTSPGTATAELPTSTPGKRPATLSLAIRFESLPGEVTLGRLVEFTVWINDRHPAYRRAVASRAEGYHLALTVASALAPPATEPHEAQAFLNRFLARWGETAKDW